MRSPAIRQTGVAGAGGEETTHTSPPTAVYVRGLNPVVDNNSGSLLSMPTGIPTSADSELGGNIVDAVNRLEQLLGYKLNATVRQVGDTTKIVVEMDKLGDCTGKTPTTPGVLEGGTFHTQQVRHPSTHYRHHDHIFNKFSTKFSEPPAVIVGINSLEIDRGANVRVHATVEDVQDCVFGAHIRTWLNTRLYSAGCTWLAAPRGHQCFQVGTFDTTRSYSPTNPQQLTHHNIVFQHPYEAPPKVVVWLNKLDLSRDHNERVIAFATDITEAGFTVHINSWDTTVLYQAGISWFAYPSGYPGICSGNMVGTSAVVSFERKFAKPPKSVLVGLNKLDSDRHGRCSFNIVTEAVSEVGMGIRVEGWGDTFLHSAGVSYIAIE